MKKGVPPQSVSIFRRPAADRDNIGPLRDRFDRFRDGLSLAARALLGGAIGPSESLYRGMEPPPSARAVFSLDLV